MLDQIDIEILLSNNYSADLVIDPTSIPTNSLTSAFVRYIHDDIAHPNNPFRVSPFRLFIVKNADPNAKAIFSHGRYCIVIHHSVLELVGNVIYKKIPSLFPSGAKLSLLIEANTNMSLAAFVFQQLSLYIYNHELAHLNKFKNEHSSASELQEEYCYLVAGNNFNARSHAMEIDVDIFAASEVAYSIYSFWRQLPETEHAIDLLYSLIALFGSGIFLFWQTMQGGWQSLYFLDHSHPHIMVRVTYILDCMTTVLEGKRDSAFPFSRDTCQLITLQLASKFLEDPQGRGLKNYLILFQDNVDAFEEYSKKYLVPISKSLPFLVQWNRPLPNI
jgi:hypothetical protein